MRKVIEKNERIENEKIDIHSEIDIFVYSLIKSYFLFFFFFIFDDINYNIIQIIKIINLRKNYQKIISSIYQSLLNHKILLFQLKNINTSKIK